MKTLITNKLDGISLELVYENQVLQSAVTRGDGLIGDDITDNVRHMPNVPKTIPVAGRVFIRGELVIGLKTFESYWKPRGAKNPRNSVAGLCKGRSTPEDLATVRFVAYDLCGDHRATYTTKSGLILDLGKMGFEIPEVLVVVDTCDKAIAVYENYDKTLRATLSYLTDGLVIEVDDLKSQDTLFTIQDGCPTYATAIKPSPKAAVTKVIGITWSMGLSGRYCPTAQVVPADLDGTTLQNVNLHNLDFLWNLAEKGFGIGAEIMVVRAGDVIPYLHSVVTPAPSEVPSA